MSFKLKSSEPQPSEIIIKGKTYPLDIYRMIDDVHYEGLYGSLAKLLVMMGEKPFTVLSEIAYRLMRVEVSPGIFKEVIKEDYPTLEIFRAKTTRHELVEAGLYDKVMNCLGQSLVPDKEGAAEKPEKFCKTNDLGKGKTIIKFILSLFGVRDTKNGSGAVR